MSCEPETDIYLAEYSQSTIVARYLSDTAVPAFTYLVREVYRPIYQEIVETLVSHNPEHHGFRILEYGCGGGMNLLQLIRLFNAQGAQVADAIGTDFSPPMIEAALSEAKQQLPAELNAVTTYLVARHETITRDLASGLGVALSELQNTFDLILGVNTFRYTHRLKKDETFAHELFALLRPGGYSIMIDMNRGFRFVGSRAHDVCTRAKQRYYIPSVRQYLGPFLKAGFVIIQARKFHGLTRLVLGSWVPASVEAPMHSLFLALRRTLDTYFSPFARHTLVIAKKPVHVGVSATRNM